MTKHNIIKGTLILTFAGFVCKIIGALSKIPLTNILTSEGLGIYQLIFPLYSLLLLISSSGIPISISKIISENNNLIYAKNVTKYALKFILILSIVLTFFVAILSEKIALLQGNVNAQFAYLIISPAIIFVGVISVFRGYFQGLQNFIPTAISQIIEQVVKVALSLLLAILLSKISIVYSVIGAVAGITISEAVSLLYLLILYKKNIRKIQNSEVEINKKEIRKILLYNSIPITITSIILPILSLLDSVMFMQALTRAGYSLNIVTSLYGIESGVVSSLLNLPIVISTAISSSIIPAIASGKNVSKNCELAYKSVLFVMLPIIIFYILFSQQILTFLFKNALASTQFNYILYAKNLLMLSSVSMLYISIMQISTSILQAKNHIWLPLVVYSVSGFIKIALNFVLLSLKNFNIYSITISSVIMYFISAVVLLIFVKKHINFKLNYCNNFLFPLSILSFLSIAIFPLLNNIKSNFLTLCIGGVIIVFLCWLLFLLFKFFSTDEIGKFGFKKFIKGNNSQGRVTDE